MKIRKIINKKSQIGTTLTWFAGFLVVFFVLGLFLVATTLFSVKKKIVSGSDEIELEKHLSDAKEQRILFSLLNSNINLSDNEVRVKDVLRESDIYNLDELKRLELKEKIENRTKEILAQEFGDVGCYIFEAKYGASDPNQLIKNVDVRGASQVAGFIEKSSLIFSNYDGPNVDVRGASYISSSKSKLLANSVNIILIRNTNKNVFGVEGDFEKVIVNFYGGKCL
ncbi:MAG: hypothetical protein WC979_05185 [Candidatus Pacearchaeota archaeon]